MRSVLRFRLRTHRAPTAAACTIVIGDGRRSSQGPRWRRWRKPVLVHDPGHWHRPDDLLSGFWRAARRIDAEPATGVRSEDRHSTGYVYASVRTENEYGYDDQTYTLVIAEDASATTSTTSTTASSTTATTGGNGGRCADDNADRDERRAWFAISSANRLGERTAWRCGTDHC